MNKQRKVLITITYNEMGIIIDTKAEEVAQPNLQQTCNNLATDAISRQATIEAMEGVDWYHINKNGQLTHGANSREDEPLYKAEDVYKVLNDMPSAQPERKTGKWITQQFGSWAECSECHELYDIPISLSNFCPNCGAKMEET